MFVNLLTNLNKRFYPKYIEKLKPLILQRGFNSRRSGHSKYYIDMLYDCETIRPYAQFDYTLVDEAIKQLKNEGKITVNNNDSPISFSLTDETFKDLLNNQHPRKDWIKSHLFDILASIVGLWGAITGTIALFLK